MIERRVNAENWERIRNAPKCLRDLLIKGEPITGLVAHEYTGRVNRGTYWSATPEGATKHYLQDSPWAGLQEVTLTCHFCECTIAVSVRVVSLEKLVAFIDVPEHREIELWHVARVEANYIGTGVPGWSIQSRHEPMILWDTYRPRGHGDWPEQGVMYHGDFWRGHNPLDFSHRPACNRCANRLRELGRENEVSDRVIFPHPA